MSGQEEQLGVSSAPVTTNAISAETMTNATTSIGTGMTTADSTTTTFSSKDCNVDWNKREGKVTTVCGCGSRAKHRTLLGLQRAEGAENVS